MFLPQVLQKIDEVAENLPSLDDVLKPKVTEMLAKLYEMKSKGVLTVPIFGGSPRTMPIQSELAKLPRRYIFRQGLTSKLHTRLISVDGLISSFQRARSALEARGQSAEKYADIYKDYNVAAALHFFDLHMEAFSNYDFFNSMDKITAHDAVEKTFRFFYRHIFKSSDKNFAKDFK